MGHDKPYREDDAPACPSMPSEAMERVQKLQEEAKVRMPTPIMKPPLPMQTEEEAQMDRDEYRAARNANSTTMMDEE